MARTRSSQPTGNVAYLNDDHPAATDGAGFYEVVQDNEYEVDDEGVITFTNAEVEFGQKLEWVKDNPDPEGENDPENNEGRFVVAGSTEESVEGEE